MGVAVLSPQDCLNRHHLISPGNKPRRRTNPNPNPNPNASTSPNRSTRRRRNSPPPPGPCSPNMGQIRILKRGEDLSPEPTKPRAVVGRIPDGFYAGSAFVTSPPPSELPLPAFFTKRYCGFGEADQKQEIASELRRVLKLI